MVTDKSNRRDATLITEYFDKMLKLNQYFLVQSMYIRLFKIRFKWLKTLALHLKFKTIILKRFVSTVMSSFDNFNPLTTNVPII